METQSKRLQAWYETTTERIGRMNNRTTYALHEFLKVCKYPIVRFQNIGMLKRDRLEVIRNLIKEVPESIELFPHVAIIDWCEAHASGAYMIATCDDLSRPRTYPPEPLTVSDDYVGMWAIIFEDQAMAAQFKLTFSHSNILSNYHFYFERPNLGLI